jgi:hypothetical protein
MTQIPENLFLFYRFFQQVFFDSVFPSDKIQQIHIFGDCTPEKKQVICSTVLSFGVIATFEGLEVNHDS